MKTIFVWKGTGSLGINNLRNLYASAIAHSMICLGMIISESRSKEFDKENHSQLKKLQTSWKI